ncbi:FHA domain-containing protein [Pseudomonas sp. S 311-6]|uniref:FHA domain-containing protein n=1 Tax=Pseudomonas TaxID=286 RepID=UPI002097F4F7|nr:MULTISPECIES: FHA domain-containing protein [Pseudomonas]MCO7567091.1 FHA domain-containing protein [Pseudomonas mosselii]MCO7618650.1 FHA domain-containing protein [Pseudomonas guariconensis]MCO7637681.1 FHA domain-containing protein [Pseudomonas sp. S 311-6]
MSTLTLSIGNLEQLEHGVTARHRFDCNGGTIGSQGADWLLWDRARGIQPIHCEIRWIEGSFCVIDHCNQTFLNDSPLSLGQRPPVRLPEGSCLRIGAYRVQVHLQHDPDSRRSLEALFTPGQQVLDALLADAASTWHDEPDLAGSPVADIREAFEPSIGHDPLAALDALHRTATADENAVQRLITGEPS